MSHLKASSDPRSILIITTSGGGGHLQAAKAKILEMELKFPQAKIITKDVLRELSGKWVGKFLVHIWDSAQRQGKVKLLECCAAAIPLYDFFFWMPVFYHVLTLLWTHDIDHIIDTQPIGLPSTVLAVRIVNFLKKRTIKIDKVLTELPTDYVSHYLKPIKKLKAKSRKLITLITTKPLITNHESQEHFWEDYSGLTQDRISYESFPLRPAFKKYQNVQKSKSPISLNIAFKTLAEKTLLQQVTTKGNLELHFEVDHFSITLSPEDYVITLMLGSQPTQEATLSYIRHFIEILKQSSQAQKYYLFVFCSHKYFEEVSLQTRIQDLVLSRQDYPSNLVIIPMSPQSDEVIAPLYFRSHTTITKSGGITAMELMAVAQGNIWIHQEPYSLDFKKALLSKFLFNYAAKNGMPKWEYGNAQYLCEMKGAQIIKPDVLERQALSLFSC